MTPAQLAEFPMLQRAFAELRNQPDLNDCHIAVLYPGHPVLHSIRGVEAALQILRPKWAQLDEQLPKLFSDQRDWLAAETELLAFADLEREGLLDCVGWPPTARGCLEGRLVDRAASNQPLAFDVKNALNSGMELVRDKLDPIVDRWRRTNGLPAAETDIEWGGVTTVEALGGRPATGGPPPIVALARDFERQLQARSTWPPEPIVVKVGPLTLSVTVREDDGLRVDSGTTGVADRQASLQRLILGHVTDKAKHGEPYLILYVRSANRGQSDVKPRDFEEVLERLAVDPEITSAAGTSKWLGAVLLDGIDPGGTTRYGFLRETADWPGTSSPETLRRSLRLQEWPAGW